MMQRGRRLIVLLSIVLMPQWYFFIATGFYTSNSTKQWPPVSVKIGALLAFNTTIGEFARRTIRLAVQDINNAQNFLNGTQLELKMYDTEYHPIQGAACALELINEGVIAIVGPQSSSISQFVAHMGRESNIPVVSFGATDPNLSQMCYSYFFRVAPSDSLQMEAVASFVTNYGWRDVVLFYTDDDYGRNGATALSNSLQSRGSGFVNKVALDPEIDKDGIDQKLVWLSNRQSRIFILHTKADMGFSILREAYYLNMMVSGYVWIVTDIITTDLGYSSLSSTRQHFTQNIIGVRRYIRQSQALNSFLTSWQKNFPNNSLDLDTSQLNAYGLYAYDAVWAIAHAISAYLRDKREADFQEPPKRPNEPGGQSELAQIRRFEGGPILKNYVSKANFVGSSGFIKFDEMGDIVGPAFEYINMVGMRPHAVGYWWADKSGVSLQPPPDDELASLNTSADDAVFLSHDSTPATPINMAIVWPGPSTVTPRGWELPKNGRPLKIGVPQKAGYTEFVMVRTDARNRTTYGGFCIQVFEAALKYLPYAVPYQYETIGDGITTPEYNQLILKLVRQEYDGVVGDVTVLAERLQLADFTQPYMESGLVVLAPVKNNKEDIPLAFLRPFKPHLWITVVLSCIFTGSVIWLLEHKVNQEFRGPPRTQLVTVLTFGFCTLFSAHREGTQSVFGRAVLLVWLYVILIISSSYTANLTSILTVEKLASSIQGLEALLQSKLPIGYQSGSFVRDYLISLGVSPVRLKPLSSYGMYQKELELGSDGGGVAAIVDELPYVQLFQQNHDCKDYKIAGQEFTKAGWGFVFPRGSHITADISEAILQMSQNGELQHIRDYWLGKSECEEGESNGVASGRLDVMHFWDLFLISVIASLVCVFIHMIWMLKEFREENRLQEPKEESVLLRKTWSVENVRRFFLFMDKSACRYRNNSRFVPPMPCPCILSCPQTSSSLSIARASTDST